MAIGELGKVLRHIQVAFDVGTANGLTDRQLVEQFTACGDSASELAFATLVQRHGPMVLRVCQGILRNHQDAEDAFQATFLILARKAGSLWVRDSMGPWLHGVACRVAVSSRMASARRRRHERGAAAITPWCSDNRDDDKEGLSSLLHEELGRLPERYRSPIVLCDLEGQTYETVARQLGWPIGTVKSRLARGRERLRARIVRRGADAAPAVLFRALSQEKASLSISSTMIDSLTQLAMGLSAGSVASKVVPAAAVGLMEGALKIMFWSKMKVAAASLAIGCGLFSVSMLCLGPGLRADGPSPVQATVGPDRADPAPNSAVVPRSTPPADEPGMLPPQPRPWETVVRMKVHKTVQLHETNHAVGFGCGTIIHSTTEESIVLTAAHCFQVDGPRDLPASNFPFLIEIDLFGGKLAGSKPAQVRFLETVIGQLVDRDFDRDVALVRIRPGRRLAASRVVPRRWKPEAGMQVLVVGCSEGRDATAWHTTITGASATLSERQVCEWIECATAPRQGRTGGGLFTSDGFVAGVCNYAVPAQNRGIYAAPSSIYHLLDSNKLTSVYEDAEHLEETKLDENIRLLEEQIQRDTLKLKWWKVQRENAAAERRSRGSRPATPPPPVVVPSGGPVVPVGEPKRPASELPDHERRLRDVEQKLDRVLKLLEDPDKPRT